MLCVLALQTENCNKVRLCQTYKHQTVYKGVRLLLLAISYNIVSCVNVCVCGVYIVSDCVLDERLCTVWCMCSINSICVL